MKATEFKENKVAVCMPSYAGWRRSEDFSIANHLSALGPVVVGRMHKLKRVGGQRNRYGDAITNATNYVVLELQEPIRDPKGRFLGLAPKLDEDMELCYVEVPVTRINSSNVFDSMEDLYTALWK